MKLELIIVEKVTPLQTTVFVYKVYRICFY